LQTQCLACCYYCVVEQGLAYSAWTLNDEAPLDIAIEWVLVDCTHCGHYLIVGFALLWPHALDISVCNGLPIAMSPLWAVISNMAASFQALQTTPCGSLSDLKHVRVKFE